MFASFCSCLLASLVYSLYALGCLLSTLFLNIFSVCLSIYKKNTIRLMIWLISFFNFLIYFYIVYM